jgi:IS5 family transposase
MAYVLRNTDPNAVVIRDLVNGLKAQIGPGALFHLDKIELTIASANASDLPTSIALVNELMGWYLFHLADTLAHKVAGTPPAMVKASDLATAITLANAIKADYGTHIASTTVNYAADATNTIAAANASDQGTLNTLLNELKTDMQAHAASGPSGKSVRLVGA